MRTIPPEDLALYRVHQLAHALDTATAECKCRYIILDNVDHLDPDIQRTSVDFVEKMASTLRARAAITIRPVTWYRAFDAHVLVRTENHCSPNFSDVLTKRLDALIATHSLPASAEALLKQLIGELTGSPDHLWTELFEATSGLSVRFAIRNLANMTQSPLLPSISEPPRLGPNAGMKASEFARAYFFGNEGAMIPRAFENLYRVARGPRLAYRLVKARIIDFISRIGGGITRLGKLEHSLSPFGYDHNLVCKALNELLDESRPLLWAHEGHDTFQMTPGAEICTTPIGVGYYESLFGQLYYDEVCIATNSHDFVAPERIIAFHKELRSQDEIEVKQFVRKQTAHKYLSIYPRECLGISVVHARKLHIGLAKRHATPPFGFDTHNDVVIQRRLAELLGLEDFS